jgi:acetyl-CoA acetyltransferase
MTTLGLALEAGYKAIRDAGLEVSDIDGVATYSVGDSTASYTVAEAMGIRDTRYFLDHMGGGSTSQTTVIAAAMAVYAGMADYVLCFRALNARSGFRMGATGRAPRVTGDAQYQTPYGLSAPGQAMAMGARLHMAKYGTTSDHLGAIAVTFRAHAALNERALMRRPITLEDYHASRLISEPFHLLDYCLESDGACAFVVTSAERARDRKRKPVYISGAAYGPGRTIHSQDWMDLTECGGKFLAPRLFGMAGVTPAEIDVACIYDAFTYMALVQLEDYGFCAKGEGGPFAASGALALGGSLPTNPHGGHLSEAYVHGYNMVLEAVEQLRGQSGARQVPNARLAIATGAPGGSGYGLPPQSNALILRN